jgi:hypothetical protein
MADELSALDQVEPATTATHAAAVLWLPSAAYVAAELAARLATSAAMVLGGLIDLTAAAAGRRPT